MRPLARTALVEQAKGCDMRGISHSWIDPQGKVHLSPRGHDNWAKDKIRSSPSLGRQFEKAHAHWVEAGMVGYLQPRPRSFLIDQGWVRVANFLTFQVRDSTSVSQRALDSAVNLIIDCAVKTGIDPETTVVRVDDRDVRTLHKVSVSEIVRIWGGRKAEDRLFDALMARIASRVAARHHLKQAEMSHAASISLMKWLSKVAKSLGVAKDVYVVGGAVRNFLIDKPIKDIDMVVDSLALKGNRDSAWVSQQIARRIPTQTDIVTDNLMVSKVFIKGPWELDGHQMEGEVIEIVNAREEVYEEDAEGNFLGHKPLRVDPTSLDVDVTRREFTFNTLMWSLADLASGPDKAEIIDLTGCGLKDLENREMRCPQDPDKTFAQDPTRIIRTIKFAFKYGFKLPPDVKAAAKRQAKGLKRIPSKAWGALRDIILENPQYKKALLVMDDLGVVEVLKDMVQADKSFANTLSNYTRNRGIAFMFDLMDLGLPVGTVGFLSGPEIKRFREITTPMDREEAQAFRDALHNPGMAYQDKKFIPSLAREMGVPGNKMKDFMPSVTAIARELLLENPKLKGRSLTNLVRQEAQKLRVASRVAGWKQAGISFMEMPSPLNYNEGSAKRLALCTTDSRKMELEEGYSERENPRSYFHKQDPCIVSFVDFIPYGGDSIFIAYMNTRDDAERKGYATKLIEEFYRRHGKKVKSDGTMYWGKLMHKGTEKLFRKMEKKYPKIYHKGKFGWAG